MTQMKQKLLSHVQLFATPWTIQSMEFSSPEYWSGSPFPSPEDLPDPGIEPRSPIFHADSFSAELPGKPWCKNNFTFHFLSLTDQKLDETYFVLWLFSYFVSTYFGEKKKKKQLLKKIRSPKLHF